MSFSDPLPPGAGPIIEWLDRNVERPIVTNPEQLTTEEARLRMAEQCGRRDLVEKLIRKLKGDER